MAAPAASALWITATLAASSRFISDVSWLLLQLQFSGLQLPLQLHLASLWMYHGCSSSFSFLDYSCPCSFMSLHIGCIMAALAASVAWTAAALAASSRFTSDVSWLLQQLHLASLRMYFDCSCSFSSLDCSCPCSFISLHFGCIMAVPAASVASITAALAASSRFTSDV